MKGWHEFSLSRGTVTLFICRDKLLFFFSYFLMSYLSLTTKFNLRQFWLGHEWTSVSERFQRDPIEYITAGGVCSYICGVAGVWHSDVLWTAKKNMINNSGSCQICSHILLHTYVADPLTHTHTHQQCTNTHMVTGHVLAHVRSLATLFRFWLYLHNLHNDAGFNCPRPGKGSCG